MKFQPTGAWLGQGLVQVGGPRIWVGRWGRHVQQAVTWTERCSVPAISSRVCGGAGRLCEGSEESRQARGVTAWAGGGGGVGR